jgi:hypothetical protein
VISHWNRKDLPGHRTWIIDPWGMPLGVTPYDENGVRVYEIDLDNTRGWYAPAGQGEKFPQTRPGWREMILEHRRPELYKGIEREIQR